MTDQKKTILITGANGFVGSRLCRLFIQHHYTVVAGVRKTADLSLIKDLKVEYRYGDVTAVDTLSEMVKDVDYVIHNAGIVKAKKSTTFFEINEKGTASLFEAISTNNQSIRKVIYISSLAAAGPSVSGEPVRESDEPHPITVYGQSKLAGERTALSYSDRFPVIAIRPPGVYGPGDKEILSFFEALNNHIKPLMGDTNRKLQLVHVDDLCRGILLAVEDEQTTHGVFFIAEKEAYLLKEMVEILKGASGRWALPLRLPGPIFRLIAMVSEVLFKIVGATPMLTREKANELLASWEVSTEKAKKELGYESAISFAEGAVSTFEWYRKEGWLK